MTFYPESFRRFWSDMAAGIRDLIVPGETFDAYRADLAPLMAQPPVSVEDFDFGGDEAPFNLVDLRGQIEAAEAAMTAEDWAEAIRRQCLAALELATEAAGDWQAWEAEVDA